jgi:N-acetylmuramoyl-L-alanine amidase CwlA
MKYQITHKLIPIKATLPNRRSGSNISKVRFLTAHDTGNLDVPANNYYRNYNRTYGEKSASAHIFIDDTEIIEVIPAFKNPEKAWHVLYDRPLDNQKYGDDANDCAIGCEMCYFTDKARSQKAYEKYVWVLAYLCHIYNLNPKTDIIGHMILDPQRKTDPANGLRYSSHTYQNLLDDVAIEYNKIDINGDEKDMDGQEAIQFLAKAGRLTNPQKWIEKLPTDKDLKYIFIKWMEDYKQIRK